MTVSKFYTVWCESALSDLPFAEIPDCAERVGEEPSIAEARETARKHGWEQILGRDFCPACTRAVLKTFRPPPPKTK